MKTVIYLRIGKTKRGAIKTEASEKPNYAPLKVGNRFIPTVSFGVEFEIPDVLFQGAGLLVGIIKLNAEEAKIATHIKVPKI
ncbi:hypothetical protein KAW50_03615 [candidate division WOR-3 bacterium]|nr:hypothetical protein [candidate division WOR-3 bacterium]